MPGYQSITSCMISGAHFRTNENKLKKGFLPIFSVKLTGFFILKWEKEYFILA